ncbi:MAG TPA: hypothetical protein PLV68_00635, partial [Ilumatobacteraceae bacterium]|nr:hypothetical protein [Ilumatobacteraceae bacterium]
MTTTPITTPITTPTPHALVTAAAATAAGGHLAAEAARFAALGWMRGTSGNLSTVLQRDPLHLAIT